MMIRLSNFISFRIHNQGKSTILTLFAITVVVFLITGLKFFTTAFLFISLMSIFFFRDPERIITSNKNEITAPADGIILKIEQKNLPKEILNEQNKDTKFHMISIHIRMHDVHIQRIPIDGIVKSVKYLTGAFINATLDKASEDNEQSLSLMEMSNKMQFAIVQISGLVNRRIVNDLYEGQEVKKGSQFGIIKFGSRVDLYLPLECDMLVKVGNTVIAGETVLSTISNKNLTNNVENKPVIIKKKEIKKIKK